MTLITRAQLAVLAPKADPKIAAAIADHADDVLPRYGLASPARLTDFMAHVLVESAYLTRLSEDLDYTAARLVQVWPTRFKTIAAAAPYAHQPEKLANFVYGGRMGNTGPNDGYLNRGQGLLQETGHDNLQALALHMRLGFEAARSALTSEAGMLEAAAAVYVMLGAQIYADKGDITGSTRAINGGVNGLADRKAMLAKCQKIWGSGSPSTATPEAPMPTPANDQVTDVKSLQSHLASLKLYSGAIDGNFGPATEAAVKAFQTSQGLLVDGVAGRKTWDALTAAITPKVAVTKAAPILQPVSAPPHLLPAPAKTGFWAGLVAKLTGKAA